MKNILITGGCGFIGSNMILYLLDRYPDYKIFNLDKLTYAGSKKNLESIEDHPNYHLIEGDICDSQLVSDIFRQNKISGVIHFAAESHVDNSIEGPAEFIRTNINGTFVLLDAARRNWMKGPFDFFPGNENNRFHHISTDEVYGSLGPEGLFTEETPYAPNSPYSASKAGSDFIVRSYFHTYGMNVVTTNCSNNYGPRQHKEKLIPTIIRKAVAGESIPIYGDGKNVRDWLYVDDHCAGIDLVFHNGASGETYNIGGKNEKENIYIAQTICRLLDEIRPRKNGSSYTDLITYVKDRPGHDRRYAIDASKIETELKWTANVSFFDGMKRTVQWYSD
jgi:dTDP-glucose 4,6-dehydratase